MKRGETSGGGQSSLGYLFGSDDEKRRNTTANPPTPAVYSPPYGTVMDEENPPEDPIRPEKQNVNKKPQGINSGKTLTGRSSTKVKSPPGGDSSIGYLFGDKS